MYGLKNDLGEHLVGEVSLPTVSVVIAAFSLNRWGDLREAVASVRAQTVQVLETVVVIDHNPELMAKAASELPEVTVVANAGLRGASWFSLAGVHVGLESWLERDVVMRLDAGPDVAHQPRRARAPRLGHGPLFPWQPCRCYYVD